MHWLTLLSIAFGAVLGAWLRWFLGLWLNPVLPDFPLGTLVANLVGGFLIGVAVGLCELFPTIPPNVKLMIITGFLGALTTFSTFSIDVVKQLTAGQAGWALLIVFAHLSGSLLMTWLGLKGVALMAAHS